jgi:hypothetical protein
MTYLMSAFILALVLANTLALCCLGIVMSSLVKGVSDALRHAGHEKPPEDKPT